MAAGFQGSVQRSASSKGSGAFQCHGLRVLTSRRLCPAFRNNLAIADDDGAHRRVGTGGALCLPAQFDGTDHECHCYALLFLFLRSWIYYTTGAQVAVGRGFLMGEQASVKKSWVIVRRGEVK